ncbi:AAA ATPase central domain protein [Catenulispora acidiphila DSM 44928]|uniref:AAA ATPase central domain protein n=1 Tax=Catenulispora acidiphila (strain DSM 44928 / JCM 14897 / NBRC 102108 / NRRL B-24433 / ID139908) TaxID=479433 RepID=C7QG18_CATAD|nr:AAA family ATPase [Catenulispora acidiphila]ACU70995.1 AAA ATPase central domain protein [Catenulispora acidiphila DSM 44928]
MADGESPLIKALRQAVRSAPEQAEFRVALAEALIGAGDTQGAIVELGEALRLEPGSAQARALMLAALSRGTAAEGGEAATVAVPAQAAPAGQATPTVQATPVAQAMPAAQATPIAQADQHQAEESQPTEEDPAASKDPGFDWSAAEAELGDIAPPPRFTAASKPLAADDAGEDPEGVPAHDVERPALTLADVGGLADVKERLQVSFLAPMRNPELRKIYGKSLRGGLLLYGPPGCGKTFIARAVAGEIGASFISVGISEVLELWFGASEKNLSELFELARRQTPCVLFFDELDALGQRRSQTRSSMMRTVVNQFLTELDSVGADNEGVFVLGATNAPWDVDPALRRPGRFDRTVLVLPPDAPAREDILQYHLRDRPIAGIDLESLVARTDGFSGADLAYLCESATENALIDAVRSGEVRMMGMADFEAALKDVRPSTGPWFDAARSVALFANEGGAYDDLAAYFKNHKGAKGL